MQLPPTLKILYVIMIMSTLGSTFAIAEEANEKKDTNFYLQTNPVVYPKEAFDKNSNIQISNLPEIKSDTIDRQDRDAIFAKVKGLQKQIETFDELDRDLLYSHSKSMTIVQLQKKYTQIPLSELQYLKKLTTTTASDKK